MKYNKELNRIKKFFEGKSYLKFFIIIIQSLIIVLSLCETFSYNYLIESVFMKMNFKKVYIPIVCFLGIYIVKFLLEMINISCYNTWMLNFKEKIRVRILSIIYHDPKKFADKNVGELKNCLDSDINEIEQYYYGKTIDKNIFLVMACIYFVCMVFYNFYLAVFCGIVMMIPLISVKFTGEKVDNASKNYRNMFGRHENKIIQYINCWKDIKINNMISRSIDQFHASIKELAHHHKKVAVLTQFSSSVVSFNRFVLSQAVVYVLGGYFIIKGDLKVGSLMIFVNYYSRFLAKVNEYYDQKIMLKSKLNSVERINDILDNDYETLKQDPTNNNDKCSLKLSHVSFNYAENLNCLDDIDLNFEKNSLNVIFGNSGCGKTTLLKIISGIEVPKDGKVLVCGKNIMNMDKTYLYDKITYVMHDEVFFNMSIRDNLLIANENASDDEMLEACKKANIYDFIMNLPEKIDTVLDEVSVNMSGGEKQRLNLARSLCRKTDIYLFDELTSALDKYNESLITDTLKELSKKAIVICVSHREMIKSYADKIIYLDSGKIVDSN